MLRLSRVESEEDEINKTLQQKVNDLLSQISVGNKVRFGSKSQKGIRKNTAPAQDREKDKEGENSTSTT